MTLRIVSHITGCIERHRPNGSPSAETEVNFTSIWKMRVDCHRNVPRGDHTNLRNATWDAEGGHLAIQLRALTEPNT